MMSGAHREPLASASFSSEDELLMSGSSSETDTTRAPFRRTAAMVVGAIALVGCAALAVMASWKSEGTMTARQLFDDPDVHEVATMNIVKVGDKMMGGVGAVEPIRRLVAETMRAHGARVAEMSPENARALDETPVTVAEKQAIVHVLSYLSDPRAHYLGLKIAHAVRDANSEDPEVLKHHIAQKMAPYMSEIRHLHHEMYPEDSPLRETVGNGNGMGFEDLLTPKRIALMKTVDDGWDMYFDGSMPTQDGQYRQLQWSWEGTAAQQGSFQQSATPSPTVPEGQEKQLEQAKGAVGLAGAVATEAASLLRTIRAISKPFGKDLNVNPAVTTGIGAASYVFELAACEVDAAADGGNPIEMVSCPMEYGSELLDAGREALAVLGILGDNNPANGKQGNHNGDNNETMGIFEEQ